MRLIFLKNLRNHKSKKNRKIVTSEKALRHYALTGRQEVLHGFESGIFTIKKEAQE